MKIITKIMAGSLLVLVAVYATAGEGKGMKNQKPAFSDFDLDGNEVISEQEFNEGHAKRMTEMAEQGRNMKGAENCPGFAGIDTDEDGRIIEEEFAAHQAEHMQKHKQHGKQEQQ